MNEIAKLNDQQLLHAAYQKNEGAVLLANRLYAICDALDPLVGDALLNDEAVFSAFWTAMIELPANSFYMANLSALHPIVCTALINWRIANKQEGTEESPVYALRREMVAVFVFIAYLLGGREWAEVFGAEMRRRWHKAAVAE